MDRQDPNSTFSLADGYAITDDAQVRPLGDLEKNILTRMRTAFERRDFLYEPGCPEQVLFHVEIPGFNCAAIRPGEEDQKRFGPVVWYYDYDGDESHDLSGSNRFTAPKREYEELVSSIREWYSERESIVSAVARRITDPSARSFSTGVSKIIYDYLNKEISTINPVILPVLIPTKRNRMAMDLFNAADDSIDHRHYPQAWFEQARVELLQLANDWEKYQDNFQRANAFSFRP